MTDSSDYIGELEEPLCPECGGQLEKVRQPAGSPLNREQWLAQIAGHWFCRRCPGDRGNTGFRYYYNRELRDFSGADRQPKESQTASDERAAWADHFKAMGWAPPEEVEELRRDAERYKQKWIAMTDEARRLQNRHLQHHEGDVYHAMQSLKVRYGFRKSEDR